MVWVDGVLTSLLISLTSESDDPTSEEELETKFSSSISVSTSLAASHLCYIFDYPKIKTDVSSSIVHSEFKYPTEFSCIKILSEE